MSRKCFLVPLALALVASISAWWLASAPPDHLDPGEPVYFSERAVPEFRRVDHNGAFSESLQALYFCASRLWGEEYPEVERVGLYRLDLLSRAITPVVLDVPDTQIKGPKVWPLEDDRAPRIIPASKAESRQVRPLAFCNDLEITADGERIYFSEPFSYEGASMGGGTMHEVLAFKGNGRIWMHDLSNGETRLVVEGFHFPDGILYDLHPAGAREVSILSSLTPGFRIMRFHVGGPQAGASEIIQDSLPGMCDGMDRDALGNIWCGLFTLRGELLTWLHGHPGVKQLLQRLPLNNMSQPRSTGVLALSPDASSPLYYAEYEGLKVAKIASVIPGPDGWLYLTPFLREHTGVVRLKNPLKSADSLPTKVLHWPAKQATDRRPR